MASGSADKYGHNLEQFTDCMYFKYGHCELGNKCKYRHCHEAAAKTDSCVEWPQTCRNIKRPYRHPIVRTDSLGPKSMNLYPQEGFIGYFWDIENVPIPKKQNPFGIVRSIRNKFGNGTALKEDSFSCFCNCAKISSDNQLSLTHANVRIVHIPAKAKPGAADREILLALDRFERAHSSPAVVVLISGDIDFVQKLNDLRYRAGFYVIVIHNKPVKEELKQTVDADYPWESFLQPQQSANETKPFPELKETTDAPTPPGNNVVNQRYNNTRGSSVPPRKHSSPYPKPRANRERKDSLQYPTCANKFESTNALQRYQDDTDNLFYCSLYGEKFRTQDELNQHDRAKDHYVAEGKFHRLLEHFEKLDSSK